MEYVVCIPLAIFIISVALQVYWYIKEIKVPHKNKLKITINRYICIFAMSIFFLSIIFIFIFGYTASWTEREFLSYFQNWGIFKIIFQILAGSCIAIHILSGFSILPLALFEDKLKFDLSESIAFDIILWMTSGIINIGWYVGFWDVLFFYVK